MLRSAELSSPETAKDIASKYYEADYFGLFNSPDYARKSYEAGRDAELQDAYAVLSTYISDLYVESSRDASYNKFLEDLRFDPIGDDA